MLRDCRDWRHHRWLGRMIRIEGLFWPDDIGDRWHHALKHVQSVETAGARLPATRHRRLRVARIARRSRDTGEVQAVGAS